MVSVRQGHAEHKPKPEPSIPVVLVHGNGTNTCDQCGEESHPVFAHDGIGEDDINHLAGTVAPAQQVRRKDDCVHEMGPDGQWTELLGPPLDLYAVKVTLQEGVFGDLREYTLGDFLDRVEHGTYAKEVKVIRALYTRTLQETGDKAAAKRAVAELKRQLPAVTPSGLFVGQRKRECLSKYSGVICYDLDDCDVPQIVAAVRRCPYIVAAFASPTKSGIKIFVVVDAASDGSNHADLWQAGKRMLKKWLGVEVDEARKDVTGLCFIGAGPVYRNVCGVKPVTVVEFPPEQETQQTAQRLNRKGRQQAQARPEKTLPEEAGAESGGKPLFTLDASLAPANETEARKVISALGYIDPSPELIWREVGMALKARWGDAAWKLFDAWSAHGKGCDENENRKRWESFSDDPDAGISLGTLFHYAQQAGWKAYDKAGIVLATSSNSDFCRDVYKITALTHTVFVQGGAAVCIEPINGQAEIVPVDAHKGIRLFEKHIQFLKWVEKEGERTLVRVPLSEQPAKLLVKGVQPGELPELKGITLCPPLVVRVNERGEPELDIAGQGYLPETGWFNAGPAALPLPTLEEAIEKLNWLYREFDFPTPGDRSRALVHPIGVALKLSGLITGFAPLDFGTANDQQAGKGTRQRLTPALFNNRVEVITQSDNFISGTSPMFKSACLAGRAFIQLDNFDHFDCREMEAFLTGENVRMRDAYGHSRSVDPKNFLVFISSNGLAVRRDLALRAWFIRIEKKPEDYQFHQYPEGDIVQHILAHQAEYLGCVYMICVEWWKQGCPRSEETRHSFRDFTQACDWIARNILREAPVMEGHAELQALYSDAGRVFYLRLWDVFAKKEKLNRYFRAGQLATTAYRFSIPIPGLSPRHHGDADAGAKLIGSLAAEVFGDSDVLDLGQGKIVERQAAHPVDEEAELRQLPLGGKPSPCYVFKRAAPQSEGTVVPGTPKGADNLPVQATPGPAPKDQLSGFRDNLLAALAEAGKAVPCAVSTQEIAQCLQDCTAKSAGRWMSQLAARYPKQFEKADTESWRGWRILG